MVMVLILIHHVLLLLQILYMLAIAFMQLTGGMIGRTKEIWYILR